MPRPNAPDSEFGMRNLPRDTVLQRVGRRGIRSATDDEAAGDDPWPLL
jgi:hypothetical protein